MRDIYKFRLYFGPYRSPRCHVGDKLPCEYRGREVVVRGISDAPIQWPYCRGGKLLSLIVFGDLVRAVRSEAEIAVAHHWGVNKHTVRNWRRSLGVPRMNAGSTTLAIVLAPERLTEEARASGRAAMGREEVRAKLSAAKAGKPLPPNMIAAQRIAVSKPKSEAWKKANAERMRKVWEIRAHGLPPSHRWTDDEIDLLGTDKDPAIAARLGVARHVVERKRRQLGIPGIIDNRFTADEIALLGTETDREIAKRLGRSVAVVRKKREDLGIAPFSKRWTDEEIALLGTKTDLLVAMMLRRSESAVETKRQGLGIPAYRRRKPTEPDEV